MAAFLLGGLGALTGALLAYLVGWIAMVGGWDQQLLPALIVSEPVIDGALLGALIGVTIAYARSTREIAEAARREAEASRELAIEAANQTREMQATRQDSLRPILSIEGGGHEDISGAELIEHGLCAERGAWPKFFSFSVRNVGPGPALNIRWRSHSRATDSPVLENMAAIGKGGEVSTILISVAEEQGEGKVSIAYEDVFGHGWVSTRTASIDQANAKYEFGKLESKAL